MSWYVRARVILFLGLAVGELALLVPGEVLPAPVPQPLPTAFDGQRAFAHVSEIVERFPRRITGSEMDRAAADWMAARFAELGLAVEQQDFRSWGVVGAEVPARYDGRNVVAWSAGQDRAAVVLGAHRDVVPETIQGAEDNASGSGALLELARVLSQSPHRLSYVFVSFGAEETGLGGSRHYLERPWAPTALAISVDTVGQDDGTRLFLADAWSLPPGAAWDLNARARAAGLVAEPPLRGPLSLTRRLPPMARGVTDSLPFALRGQSAVGIGWIEPPYLAAHTPADTLGRVSPTQLARVGTLVEGFVRAVDADGQLLAPGDYLLSADGHYVSPARVALAGALLVAFAGGQIALTLIAWTGRCGSGCRSIATRPGSFLVPLAGAALGGVIPLVHSSDVLPRPWELLLWTAWWAICVALPARLRSVDRTAQPADLPIVAGLSFLGFSLLINPFFALLAAGYPLLVLSWLPLGLSLRARRLSWGLLIVWATVALVGLLAACLASVLVPEIVPPVEAAIGSTLLLWPLTAALRAVQGSRRRLASSVAFR